MSSSRDGSDYKRWLLKEQRKNQKAEKRRREIVNRNWSYLEAEAQKATKRLESLGWPNPDKTDVLPNAVIQTRKSTWLRSAQFERRDGFEVKYWYVGDYYASCSCDEVSATHTHNDKILLASTGVLRTDQFSPPSYGGMNELAYENYTKLETWLRNVKALGR